MVTHTAEEAQPPSLKLFVVAKGIKDDDGDVIWGL